MVSKKQGGLLLPVAAGAALLGYLILSKPAGGTPPPTQSGLVVKAVDQNGAAIPGLFATVSDQAGNVLYSGGTPLQAPIPAGTVVVVGVQNYQNFVFSYWQNNFQIERTQTLTVGSYTELTAVYSTNGIPIPPPVTGGNNILTVQTIGTDGLPITGMFVTFDVGGQRLGTGFSPATFSVVNGAIVTVGIQNYTDPATGVAENFQSWTDGNNSATRNVTMDTNKTLTAIIAVVGGNPTTPPPTNTGTSKVTANSYLNGTNTPVPAPVRITRLSNGTIINQTTPYTFDGVQGETYTIEIQNPPNYAFDHWGNGSTNPIRSVTVGTGPITATAYFVSTVPLPEGTTQLTVAASTLAGTPAGNFFTTLYDNVGVVADTGFTPVVFNILPNQNYDIAVADFGTSAFVRWSDGVTTRRRTINISNPTTYTAIFQTA